MTYHFDEPFADELARTRPFTDEDEQRIRGNAEQQDDDQPDPDGEDEP